jgi:hypothetical protein
MPIDPVNPLGWGQKDPITSGQMNGIDQRLVRAVDGVQGGSYSGPVNLTASTLTGTSSVDTTGLVRTKGVLQGGVLVVGSTNTGSLGDGAVVNILGLVSSIIHLTTNVVGGTPTITLQFSFVLAGGHYLVALDHRSAVLLGRVHLVWAGNGITHRFSGGVDMDGQPTPGPTIDLWTGVAISASEIWWTVTRDLE